MRLFPLLFLSLPLLLLSGLAKAEEADGKGPPGECDVHMKKVMCNATHPFCSARIDLNVDNIFVPHVKNYKSLGCEKAMGFGCNKSLAYHESFPMYDCYCDSRIVERCSEKPLVKDNLTAIAVEMYKVAHSTTPPPTTTPDPKHYCLIGSEMIVCPAASFCNSKIFLDPDSRFPANETGLGCVDKLPGEGLEDGCRMVVPFNSSNPFFECFCKSVQGRACNDLKEATNSERKTKWVSEGWTMLSKVMKEEEVEKYKKSQITTPDPNHYCLNSSSAIVCPASKVCHSKIFVDTTSRYPNNHTGFGCVDKPLEGSLIDECRKIEPFTLSKPVFECFCHSDAGHACNNLDEAMNAKLRKNWYRTSFKLLREVEKAQTTTPPPTTTADTNHYCLSGSSPIGCSHSSFCHSKIFLDPTSRYQNNHTGVGCMEKLPGDSPMDGCRMVEPFALSKPVLDCFCHSEIGRSCNNLDQEANAKRRDSWYRASLKLLKEVEEAQTTTAPPTMIPPPTTTADPNTTSGSSNALILFSHTLLLLALSIFSLSFSPTE